MANVSHRNRFGFVDAARTPLTALAAQHIGLSVQDRIKWGNRDSGTCIIVGIKGSGKTDLRRFISASDPKAMTLDLNANSAYVRIDTSQLTLRSGRIKNVLALVLLDTFGDRLSKSTGGRHKLTIEKLRTAVSRTRTVIGRIPAATTLTTPIASMNLALLTEPAQAACVTDAWTGLVEDLGKALDIRRGYILIDDVEDVFPGIEGNPDFLEGLARAVMEINHELGAHLHALLFVKYGIWRNWFEHQREYDRVAPDIEHLAWTEDSLIRLIARRVAYRNQLDPDGDVEALWAHEFAFEDFTTFTREFTQICVSGPRDIVDLCNQCGEAAGGEAITLEHLAAVVPRYSEAKLKEIGADFCDVYPDVDKLVPLVLRKSRAAMKFEALARLFEQRALLDQRVRSQFMKHKWFATSAAGELGALMFKIGVAGVEELGRTVYAMEEPNRLIGSEALITIHPAFRPILSTTRRLSVAPS